MASISSSGALENMSVKGRNDEERFLVINAWNKLAEGMTLEPSDMYEYRFLERVRGTKRQVLEKQCHGPLKVGNHSLN
jgi:hypothetical protein